MSGQDNEMPERFRLGHPAIDMQHEVLFALYRELTRSLQQGNEGYGLSDIFMGLLGYVVTHFQYEEDLMSATHYPDFENHGEGHRQLTETIGVLYERFTNAHDKDAEKSVAQDVAVFLADWLAHHISETDRKLVHFLNTHVTNQ